MTNKLFEYIMQNGVVSEKKVLLTFSARKIRYTQRK